MADKKKNFDASPTSVGEYLKLPRGTCFEIPHYQRAYSWKIENCEKLIQDIYEFDPSKGDHYFFGTVIIDCSKDRKQQLIDGQQRTTTFLLMLKALQLVIKKSMDSIKTVDNEMLADLKESHDSLLDILFQCGRDKDRREIMNDWNIVRKGLGESLIVNNSINETFCNEFQTIIEAETYEEALDKVVKLPYKQKNDTKYSRFFNNFNYFYEKFNTQEYLLSLNSFTKKVLEECQVIVITSWETEQAISMFNSLNSAGLPLTDSDIISAQLYSNAETERDEFNKRWKEIVELSSDLEKKKVVDLNGALQQYMYITRAKEEQYNRGDVTTPGLRKYYMTEHSEILNNPLGLCDDLKKILDIWDKVRVYPITKLLFKFNANF